MSRTIVEPAIVDPVAGFSLPAPTEPTRILLRHPCEGGIELSIIRQCVGNLGKFRISAGHKSLFVDVDPGTQPKPVVTLDIIARSDAKGLRRAIESALPFVDFVQVNIDERSDQETAQVAIALADRVDTFNAAHIGVSAEEWIADRIHFANARNLGRARVTTPWTMVLDTDEYIERAGGDIHQLIRAAHARGLHGLVWQINMGDFVFPDGMRLALTKYRWKSGTHNKLKYDGPDMKIDAVVRHDPGIRTEAHRERRRKQRSEGTAADLDAKAAAGDLHAMIHVIKQAAHDRDLKKAEPICVDFRKRTELHGAYRDERIHLANQIGALYYESDNFAQATVWALRALLDGPHVDPLCLLGDIAEDTGDLEAALVWFEAACAVPKGRNGTGLTSMQSYRFGRREGLRRALKGTEHVDARRLQGSAGEPGENGDVPQEHGPKGSRDDGHAPTSGVDDSATTRKD